jgi:hypothetical protein
MVNALTKPGDAGKKLKDIREKQKGITKTDDEESPVVAITPALAAEYLIAAHQTGKGTCPAAEWPRPSANERGSRNRRDDRRW